MTQILHIKSSSNLTGSHSRQIGALTVAELKNAIEGATVVERDLVKDPLPHISPEFVGSLYSPEVGLPEMALSDELTTELLKSDILVIESPMYNFSIPSALKAWIDHVARAGRTFQYGASGPEGLAVGKKAILVLASGGVYSSGAYQAYSHQESYLKQILGFIGITDVEVIHIEGVGSGPEKAAEAVEDAKKKLLEVVGKVTA
ncbi:FMN-dependent NADH-azoreductase [bacterium]|nr:MAG: FMN-dependent NADH-azoreductase [bacterium]